MGGWDYYVECMMLFGTAFLVIFVGQSGCILANGFGVASKWLTDFECLIFSLECVGGG